MPHRIGVAAFCWSMAAHALSMQELEVSVQDASTPAASTSKSQIKGPRALSRNTNSNIAAQIRVTSKPSGLYLQNGYEALQQGNLSSARPAYEKALQEDASNADALAALALIHWREGRTDAAEMKLQRALAVAPKDPGVLAVLAMLHPTGDPLQMESRLKSALADQPDAWQLHFALGNVYARQQRWADAQHAYFLASTGDPGNPDYLFNLAVSLEHINQPQLALRHYREAVAAAHLRPPSFEDTLAQQRIDQLQAGKNTAPQ